MKAESDLRTRRGRGDPVDSGDVKRHRDGVFRLLAILDLGVSLSLPEAVRREMALFLEEVVGDVPAELKRLGLGDMTPVQALDTLRASVQLA